MSYNSSGLRTRAVFLCVLLLLSTAGVIGTVLIQQNRQHILATIENSAATFARAIAVSAEPAILLDDHPGYQSVLQTAATDPTLVDARIFDAGWQELARLSRRRADGYTFHPVRADSPDGRQPAPGTQGGAGAEVRFEYRGQPVQPESTGAGSAALPDVQLIRGSDELVVLARVTTSHSAIELPELEGEAGVQPSEGKLVGYVVLTLSLVPLHNEILRNALSGMLLTIGVLILGCGATIVAVRQLLRPLNNLVEATRAIAEGDRSKRASESAVGEIGELARAFNHMAESLQASYDSIERTVAERTAELVRASRAKDDFLANMSHEIRTPMTAILGFTEHLVDPRIDPAEREAAAETVRRNGQHLLQIINDILDLSKIEAGRLDIERKPCSVVSLLAEVASLMRVRAIARQLEFSAELDGPLPATILTDPTRLRQILLNLISNAIKFTNRGCVRIVARMVPGMPAESAPASNGAEAKPPESGHWLQFDIIDTGIGMTPEQVRRVFRPFTQADESMSRRFGGTGLGLAISKRLAGLLGGGIEVLSEFGRGSTFRVTIDPGPLSDVNWIADPSLSLESGRALKPTVTTVDTQSLSGARILLAEDGEDNQRLIAALLRRAGAEVHIVENGRLAVDEALSALDEQIPFDLILMDMQMPEMDGYTATRMLRNAAYPRPIIALTAHAMSSDREKCLQAGCDDYLTKPIDRDRLIALISAHLRRTAEPAVAAS